MTPTTPGPRRSPTYFSATSTTWRAHFPHCCYRCLRRLVAGVVFDHITYVADRWVSERELRREALWAADEYLASMFGEV